MAKSESRSKGGAKGKPSGGGSGSAPSSPTRRLKKGGKRGRRLCHMDGCTLCPSFGFEGDVAVSCSHHKEDGMRNLTARRCQHEGCFTVANFGMPGDKPGYCAAHSTDGMVNRNKPRGAEGMLAGVTIARSSRRAAKANTVLLEAAAEAARAVGTPSSSSTRSSPLAVAAAAAAAAAAGAGAACAARNRPSASSGGKDLLLRAVAAAGRDGGRLDADGEMLPGKGFSASGAATRAVVGTRARTSVRLREARGSENSDSEEMPDFNGGERGAASGRGGGRGEGSSEDGVVIRRTNHAGGKIGNKIGTAIGRGSGISSEELADNNTTTIPAAAAAPFVTFVARGEDLEPVPIGAPSSFSSSRSSSSSSSSSSSCSSNSSSSSSSGRRVDATKGVAGAGRVRPRGGFGAAAMTVTAGVLHRQEAGFPGYRGGDYRGGDDFQRRYADGISLGVGVGVGGRGSRGVGMGMDFSFPGEVRGAVMMDGGPFLMEPSSCLSSGVVDAQMGFDLGVGLEDMLVSEASDSAEGGLQDMAFIGQAGFVGSVRVSPARSFSDQDDRVGVVTPSGVRTTTQHDDALRVSGGGLALATASDGVDGVGSGGAGDIVGGGEGLSVGGVGVDFELDHLPELNTMDLTGLRAVEPDCDGDVGGVSGGDGGVGVSGGGSGCDGVLLPREPRQLSSRTLPPATVPGPLSAAVCPPELQLDGGGQGMTRLPSTSDISSAATSTTTTTALLSSGVSPPSRSTVAATGSASMVAPRSTTASVPLTEALVPAKLPCEEAWWDVLEGEGEDFVAMPEPVWGAALDGHGLDQEDVLRVGGEQQQQQRGWRGGDGSAHGDGNGGGGGGGSGGCFAGDATGGVSVAIRGDGRLANISSSSSSDGSGNVITGRDAPDGMMVAHNIARTRSSLSSSPGIGGVLTTLTGDVGFPAGDISRGGDRGDFTGSDGLALAGIACRRVGESAGDGGCGGSGIGVIICGGGGGGGGRLSPAKKRHRLAGGAAEGLDPFQSPPFVYGASHHPAKRELGTTPIFPSSSSLSSSASSYSSSSCSSSYSSSSSSSSSSSVSASFALSSGIYSAAPVSFGLTVTSNVHGPPPASLPHGGVGLRSGAGLQGSHLQGGHLQGGHMGKTMGKAWVSGDGWVPGDALSPSKCLALSPTKIVSTSPSSSARPLLAPSAPTWGPGPLCSPQQTQAAGRA